MTLLASFSLSSWKEEISPSLQQKALESLEKGKVLYFPSLGFALHETEKKFLNPAYVDPKRKNISFTLSQDLLGGVQGSEEEQKLFKNMMRRYAEETSAFLRRLLPSYTETLQVARTSFRPTEIAGRKSSMRKDDTRLHVDAFPSSPTQGRRILRMFTNVNPDGKARVWRVGEPFEEVVNKYACTLSSPLPLLAKLQHLLKMTKGERSLYDHYMLSMHNKMKEDTQYQRLASQEEISFPPGSSWIVFTDQVSHAAMSGQHLFEQTFSLPIEGLQEPSQAPLRVLEKFFARTLV